MNLHAVEWRGALNGALCLIDQTLLPETYRVLRVRDVPRLIEAIRVLRVRGAPAIGVAAAYGVVLATRASRSEKDLREQLDESCRSLAATRPTAVNLSWALRRMQTKGHALLTQNTALEKIKRALLEEAQTICAEDIALCDAIGNAGANLIKNGCGVLTHCNAGALATAGAGTALSVLYAARDHGARFHVYADETRPLLQGARLTAWELTRANIPVTVLCDNMAGALMRSGKIHLVVTGADRVCANGDAANKIGTYSVAVLARAHRVPFYIAAPYSTFDFTLKNGTKIPIEQRSPDEVALGFGKRTIPRAASVYNPAFDVTPHGLIAGIITERGILRPPYLRSLARYARLIPRADHP